MASRRRFPAVVHPDDGGRHRRARRGRVGQPARAGRQRPHRRRRHRHQRPRRAAREDVQPHARRRGRLHLRPRGEGPRQGHEGGVARTQAHPAKAEKDFRRVLEQKDVDAVVDRRARSLARAGGHPGAARPARTSTSRSPAATTRSRPNCSRRRRSARQPHRPGRQPAAVVAQHHRPDAPDPRRQPHRPRVFRPRLVREHPRVDRRRQGSPGARRPRLRVVAGARRRAVPTRTTSSTTTGTGSGTGARARPATTATTRST